MHALRIASLALTLSWTAALPAIAEDGTARLKQSTEFIAQLPAFSADVAMKFDIGTSDGKTRTTSLTGQVALAGDDRARMTVETDQGALELYYAPDSKFLYLAGDKQYIETSHVKERQQALTMIPGREYRPSQILFSDYLHDSNTLLDEAEKVSIVAEGSEIEGAPSQVRVEGGGIVVDFWIRHGESPVLEKFAMDLTGMLSANNPQIANAVITYTISNWILEPGFKEGYFAFAKPDGATEFTPPEQAADALEGKPAPPITLDLLEGGKLDLASHKGKNIVILDFWASWCGPCRIGLPIVTEVTEQFKDKNVVLYAVNVGENRETAQAFVDETGLEAPVAMDPRGDAQRKYQANSIPKTVIIDKEGTVHEVHDGVAPNAKSMLTRTLTELTE